MSMNGGDAAEQMVRILLDGTETVVKIMGEGARQLAAFLYAWAQAQQEHGKNPAQHGRTSMVRLLKSGQELQVFRLRKEEYEAFKPEARRYKLLYAALRNKREPDGLIDVVVRTDEIPRVNHVLERLGYGSVQQGENSKKKEPPSSRSSSAAGDRPRRSAEGADSRGEHKPSVKAKLELYRSKAEKKPVGLQGRGRKNKGMETSSHHRRGL